MKLPKGLHVLGIPELKKECDRTAKELMEEEEPTAMAAGEVYLRIWRGLVPVLDGNYRNSLVVAWLGKAGAAVGTSWLPGLDRNDQPVLYAKTLEFGRGNRPAEPSARPAQEAGRGEALAAGGREMRTVVKGRKPRKSLPRLPAHA